MEGGRIIVVENIVAGSEIEIKLVIWIDGFYAMDVLLRLREEFNGSRDYVRDFQCRGPFFVEWDLQEFVVSIGMGYCKMNPADNPLIGWA